MTPGAPSRVSALSLPSGVPAHTLRSRHRSSLSRSPTSPQPFQARAGLRDEAGRTRRSALHGPLARRRRSYADRRERAGVCRRRAALARHPRTTSQPARSSPSRRAIPPAPLWRRSLVDPMRSARDAGPRAAHAGNAGSRGRARRVLADRTRVPSRICATGSFARTPAAASGPTRRRVSPSASSKDAEVVFVEQGRVRQRTGAESPRRFGRYAGSRILLRSASTSRSPPGAQPMTIARNGSLLLTRIAWDRLCGQW